jgi:hypothetical protein
MSVRDSVYSYGDDERREGGGVVCACERSMCECDRRIGLVAELFVYAIRIIVTQRMRGSQKHHSCTFHPVSLLALALTRHNKTYPDVLIQIPHGRVSQVNSSQGGIRSRRFSEMLDEIADDTMLLEDQEDQDDHDQHDQHHHQ